MDKGLSRMSNQLSEVSVHMLYWEYAYTWMQFGRYYRRCTFPFEPRAWDFPLFFRQPWPTVLSPSPKSTLRDPIALMIAIILCMVLLYTTGLYCLQSSSEYPSSWMILSWQNKTTTKLNSTVITKKYIHVHIQYTIFIPEIQLSQ